MWLFYISCILFYHLYPVNIISINFSSNEHQIFIIIIWQFDLVNCSYGEVIK